MEDMATAVVTVEVTVVVAGTVVAMGLDMVEDTTMATEEAMGPDMVEDTDLDMVVGMVALDTVVDMVSLGMAEDMAVATVVALAVLLPTAVLPLLPTAAATAATQEDRGGNRNSRCRSTANGTERHAFSAIFSLP